MCMNEQNYTPRTYHYTPTPPFVSNRRELLSGLVSYVLAYLYIGMWTCVMSVKPSYPSYLFWQNFYLLTFCGGFTAWELWYSRHEKSSREHWAWLACVWVCVLSYCVLTVGEMKAFPLQLGRIWDGWCFLFVHLYAVYWVLCRSGRLLEGKSGAMVVFDGINGLVFYPFRHFCLRESSILYAVTHREKKEDKESKLDLMRLGYGALAVCIGVGFLVTAASLLTSADAGFDALVGGLLALIPEWDLEFLENFVLRLMLSIPVGAYLNGLVSGSLRQSQEDAEKQRKSIHSTLNSLKKIPVVLWEGLLAAFGLLYLLFFVVQGRYLFGAMMGAGPVDGFTVAEYARQGFFELCKIMALNFALLWVIAVSSEVAIRQRPVLKLLSTVLMGESVLFAVTAFSKLALYISRFSFTPLRIQSAWGILVMLTGCLCVIFQLWTGKKTARFWVLFTGLSLAVTILY